MLLTVHDELVFEVPEGSVEAAAELVRDRMEHAIDARGAPGGFHRLGPELVRRRPGGPLTPALTAFPLVTYHLFRSQGSCAARKSKAASR